MALTQPENAMHFKYSKYSASSHFKYSKYFKYCQIFFSLSKVLVNTLPVLKTTPFLSTLSILSTLRLVHFVLYKQVFKRYILLYNNINYKRVFKILSVLKVRTVLKILNSIQKIKQSKKLVNR